MYQPEPDIPGAIYGENIQSTFFEDVRGDLWFTTYDGGVNRYVRSSDSFEHFIHRDSAGNNIVGYHAFFLGKDGKLWLIMNGHDLYYFDIHLRQFFRQMTLPHKVVRAKVLTDSENRLKKIFAYSYQGKGFCSIGFNAGGCHVKEYLGEADSLQLVVKTIFPVHDSLLWIGAIDGLYKYFPTTGKIEAFRVFDGNPIRAIYEIVPYGDDQFILASKEVGVLMFDKRKDAFIERVQPNIREEYGLTSNEIAAIYKDNDGGFWVSTDQLGVDYFYPQKKRFDSIILENEINGNVTRLKPNSMLEDNDGNVWCSVVSAVIYVLDVKGNVVKQLKHEEGNPHSIPNNETIFLYKTEDGRIWISTWEGMAVWIPEKQQIVNLPYAGKAIMGMCKLKDGMIVLSTYGEETDGGLYQLVEKDPLDFQYKQISATDPTKNYLYLWEDSKGDLYACNSLTSISVFDVKNNFRIKKEIPIGGSSETYYEDPNDHSIWIGSSSGLYHINANLDEGQLEVFTEENGLPSKVIYGILPDDQNRLWISTNRGLVNIDLGTYKIQVFSQADGLVSTDFSSFSFVRHSSGKLWFGYSGGISLFSPENVQPIKARANPIVTNIYINDEPDHSLKCSKTGATNVSEIKQLELDYLSNTVSFTFAALEYSDPTKTQFQYMLKGVDKDWVKNGVNNTARYAKIPFGQYEFLLKASNSDGVWSGPTSLSIVVAPPFYRTYWFYFLMGLLASSLVWMAVLYRKKRRAEKRLIEEEKREALEQERQRIARDVHDDLGSGLSALSLQIALVQYKTDPEEIRSDLEKINTASRDLSGKIREVIWTVSAKNDTLANLISYLNLYALDLLENTSLDISINLPEKIPDVTVTGEYRRTTFLAFKEALNNLLKHARASQVDINFTIEDSTFQVEVTDNGIGFDPQLMQASTGNGLMNMRARMKEIGGNCKFETSDNGSKVTFLLNLKAA